MTDCIFSVARIRELENALLTSLDFDELLSVQDKNELIALLNLKGIPITSPSEIYSYLERENESVLSQARQFSIDSDEMKFFSVLDIFETLKFEIKDFFKNRPYDSENFDKELHLPVLSKKTDSKFVFKTASDSLEVLEKTHDPQLFDAFVDRRMLEKLTDLISLSRSEMFKKYVDFFVSATNLKVAYRGAAAGKSMEFFRSSLFDNGLIDSENLAEKAVTGTEAVIEFSKKSGFFSAGECLEKSPEKFDVFLSDSLTEILKEAKYESFTFDPIFAYTAVKLTELQNLRIIFTCKKNRISPTAIKERLRKTYV